MPQVHWLFDFNGVVADCEVILLSTLQSALRAYEINLEPEDVRQRFLGEATGKFKKEQVQIPSAKWDDIDAHWHSVLFEWLRTNFLRCVNGGAKVGHLVLRPGA